MRFQLQEEISLACLNAQLAIILRMVTATNAANLVEIAPLGLIVVLAIVSQLSVAVSVVLTYANQTSSYKIESVAAVVKVV